MRLAGALQWLVPVGLTVLAVAVAVALVVARSERPSRALLAATPAILGAAGGAPPELAAIDAQLAQIRALHAEARYGSGLTHVVSAPVPVLRPSLGEEWRELGNAVGRVYLLPSGRRARFYEVSVAVVAPDGPARLTILTSQGQQLVEPVGRAPFQLINLGPLPAPLRGGVGLALNSKRTSSQAPGPRLLISPIQSEYLEPGDWVTGMPALAEVGPGGARGLYLAGGSSTRFAMTPTPAGTTYVTVRGAGIGRASPIEVTVDGRTQRGLMPQGVSSARIGPFATASSVLALSIGGAAKSPIALFISDIRFEGASLGHDSVGKAAGPAR